MPIVIRVSSIPLPYFSHPYFREVEVAYDYAERETCCIQAEPCTIMHYYTSDDREKRFKNFKIQRWKRRITFVSTESEAV